MYATFTVPGEPQGKARARTLKSGRSYTPKKTAEYEARIRRCYAEQVGRPIVPPDEKRPVYMQVLAVFPIPVSYSKKRRAAAEGQTVFPTKRPDADNIAKAVCDALNGTAYGDDAQIVRLQVKKVYGEPHLMVLIGEEEHDGTGEENADQQREDGLGDAAGGV